MSSIVNFSAGPAMLPSEVLEKVKNEWNNWKNTGISILETSHRSDEFAQFTKETELNFRQLLQIPENYKVLFFQGGAMAQFSAIPLNLLQKNESADYIISGIWSKSAAKEAEIFNPIIEQNILFENIGKKKLKKMKDWILSENGKYIHFCVNETIDGIAIYEMPEFNDRIVIADCSSSILSQPIDVSKFGIIYAGAQKNIAPAGLTLMIIREDLIHAPKQNLPSIFNYQKMTKNNSMLNTPPVFPWYFAGLVFKWVLAQGGLQEMEKRNQEKSNLLYHAIDKSELYENSVDKENRSMMNVVFRLSDPKLESIFIKKAHENGLIGLAGHRSVGGIRASIYNAMNIKNVQQLVNFMQDFECHLEKL